MEDCVGQVYGLGEVGLPSQGGTLWRAVDKFAQVQDFFGKIVGGKRDLDSNHVF